VRINFVGPTYANRSPADNEECFDWFVEKIESGKGEAAYILMPRAGKSLFGTIASPTRGGIEFNGRAFVAGGTYLYELFTDGTATAWRRLPMTVSSFPLQPAQHS
jgi:hypothetical protein